jgi:hypothetical protein
VPQPAPPPLPVPSIAGPPDGQQDAQYGAGTPPQ